MVVLDAEIVAKGVDGPAVVFAREVAWVVRRHVVGDRLLVDADRLRRLLAPYSSGKFRYVTDLSPIQLLGAGLHVGSHCVLCRCAEDDDDGHQAPMVKLGKFFETPPEKRRLH